MVTRADYDAAVADLRTQLAALPPDAPVRLGKKTSNLFRPRAGAAHRLDVSRFSGVLSVEDGFAEVLGMTTYEDLVDATLPSGQMPLVVPQLKTLTLGGAVTGLGIESTSVRSGPPHESVEEMDVFTGAGDDGEQQAPILALLHPCDTCVSGVTRGFAGLVSSLASRR